jgi:Tfp pilus assembly pilus retraction ATPase PilT
MEMFRGGERLLPERLRSAIINRLKIVSDLDITKRTVPQNGKFHRIYQGRRINFNISTFPIASGEQIIIKVFDLHQIKRTLEQTFADLTICKTIQQLSDRKGLLLVVGDNISGVNITLHTLLREFNHPNRNIYSVEDPIEFPKPPSFVQIEVTPKQNMADVLRNLQNQNPDVIWTSKIQSPEIAQILVSFAQRSSVISSLSPAYGTSALEQMLAMGISPAQLSTSISGIIFQRLLRRICRYCGIVDRPTVKDLNKAGFNVDAAENTFYCANVVETSTKRSVPHLVCSHCQGKGYQGYIPVFEVLVISENIRNAIAKGEAMEQVRQIAIAEGMKTIVEYSHDLVKKGYVSLVEVSDLISSNILLEKEKDAKLQRDASNKTTLITELNPIQELRIEKIEEVGWGIIETLDLLDKTNQQVKSTNRTQTSSLTSSPISPPSNYPGEVLGEVWGEFQQLTQIENQAIKEKLLQVLLKLEITCIETIGEPFDSKIHEPIVTSTSKLSNNIVVNEFKPGYRRGNKVLRLAQVEVSIGDWSQIKV